MRRAQTAPAVALTAILTIGIALRAIEYAALGSLWLDELFIALNVTTRSWDQLLTTPLIYHQVAPVGFLAVLKLATRFLGANEAALRLFPFICSIASLFLFWRISVRFLSPFIGLSALAVFSVSPALLWYSRNAKQYSSDVAVVLLLIWIALRFREGRSDQNRTIVSGIVGGIAILFSHPAVLVAGVLVMILLIQEWTSKRPSRPLVYLAVGWSIGAIIVIRTSLILSPAATREFMRAGWGSRGFLPFGPEILLWIPHKLSVLLGLFVGQFKADTGLEELIAGALALPAVLGLPYLLHRNGGAALIVSAPILASILGSAARILPLSGRVSIYVAPMLLLIAMAGIDHLRSWLPREWRTVVHVIALAIVIVPVAILVLFIRFPDRREETRPVLEELRSRWQQGDEIYVLPPARPAMEFYGKPLGFRSWQTGANLNDLRSRLKELDSFRGQSRLWIFFTHAVPCRQGLIRAYLEAIGREIDRIEDPYGNTGKREAAAYLFDLSDPDRLARTNAVIFPIPAHIAEDCGYPEKDPWTRARDRLRSFMKALRG